MALKSKQPLAGASRDGDKMRVSFSKATFAMAAMKPKQRLVTPTETIDARLERKAARADARTFATESLGQMTRKQRHKLLYGD